MKKFEKLSKAEMKNICGGMLQGGATATCGNYGDTVSCSGTDCQSETNKGCSCVTSSGTIDEHKCPSNVP